MSAERDPLTIAEFAKKLRVTTRTVHNWRKEGRVVARALPNGRYLIPYSEYERIWGNGHGQVIVEP